METKITWNAQTLEGAVHKVEHEALKVFSPDCDWNAAPSKFPEPSPMEHEARSPDERRQILAQQAEQMNGHYEQTTDELAEWQAGDFTDG